MRGHSSRREGTRGNTYTDLGADTEEGYEISSRSRSIARSALGERSIEDRIRQRCAIAVGDLTMAALMRFRNDPVTAGLGALRERRPIVCDIRMVQTGILKQGHRSEVLCALDQGVHLARQQGITRTSAGFLALDHLLDAAIVVIGNAPSALRMVCRLSEQGCSPALVIGVPVGFVNAAEAKEELRRLPVPSITTEGTRGGTPVAVASMNELITIFSETNGR